MQSNKRSVVTKKRKIDVLLPSSADNKRKRDPHSCFFFDGVANTPALPAT
jgi:hypothetical protein